MNIVGHDDVDGGGGVGEYPSGRGREREVSNTVGICNIVSELSAE